MIDDDQGQRGEAHVEVRQNVGGKSRLIWRAVVLSWIAWCIGCEGMVVTHRCGK